MTEPASEPAIVPRRALDEVQAALADTRVVTINGARQVGKSTLAGLVVGSTPGAMLRTLDDPLELAAAQADPVPFIRHDGLLCIDEIQRAPELLLAIKASVDRDPRPGRFLLTGSTRVLALADLPDALVGRMQAVELWPLSQGEMTGEGDAFVSAAFQHGAELDVESAVSRDDYAERIVRGGFPEAVRRTDARRRAQFFGAYLNNLLERDIRQLSDVGRLGDLRRLAGAVAARSAGLLVAQALAARHVRRAAGDARTGRRARGGDLGTGRAWSPTRLEHSRGQALPLPHPGRHRGRRRARRSP
ncbi:MAG: AAA family ATPase, partial [Actinomycetota bacterium]|nr:AAA family ATPase [Actinomycetota bacterium]